MSDCSEHWLKAFTAATECLRKDGDAGHPSRRSHNGPAIGGGRGGGTLTTDKNLDCALAYLILLEEILQKKIAQWDYPPNEYPPSWMDYEAQYMAAATNVVNRISEGGSSEAANDEVKQSSNGVKGINKNSKRQVQNILQPRFENNTNPFSSFQNDDEDSDDEVDKVHLVPGQNRVNGIADELEAGDTPTWNTSITQGQQRGNDGRPSISNGSSMDMRRLLIRVLTLQSDLIAVKATAYRQSKLWTAGASQYTVSLQKIHQALILADSKISKWLEETQTATKLGQRDVSINSKEARRNQEVARDLMEDAKTVEIAIQSLTTERERYLVLARQKEAYLLNKLKPQWESRDDVKRRLGDRWFNNPNAKHQYTRLRQEAENQLKDVQAALLHLETIDTSSAAQTSKMLNDMIQDHHNRSKSMAEDHASDLPQSPPMPNSQRYNGMRPIDLTNRVDIDLYPDPTEFGWTFTGSWGVTEFFEKDGVKLDWYYTTATVKTSLDHPTQGKTQLFAAQVDPQTYIQILLDPRAHTGERYHTRQKKKHNKSRRNPNRNRK